MDERFPVQKAFLLDDGHLIALLCTRRASKSTSAAKRLIRAMYKHPGCSTLFIGLTKESARGILWKDVLKVLNREHGLGAVFSESKLEMTLPNGSVLKLLGMDANDDEKEKALGQKYAEVCIDEGASYGIDLYALIYGILLPAVSDYLGVVTLIGTPANVRRGFFFELTQGQDPMTPGRWTKEGWSCHRWNTFENPYMRERWETQIAQLKAAKPGIEETPLFQQHYLGRWTIDDSKLVYRYLAGRNDFNGTLPPVRGRGEWHHVLSIDLGFTDATSFTVSAYHDHLPTLFLLKSYKRAGLDITAVALEVAEVKKSFPIESTVIDGANKQAVQELNNRHGLEAVPADKREKAEFIDIMNAELLLGRIRVSPQCQALKDEWVGLIWDERKLLEGKRVEHPGCENHCADGALYGWRKCWQYLATPEPAEVPKLNTPEWHAAQVQQQETETEAMFQQEFEANAAAERERHDDVEWL